MPKVNINKAEIVIDMRRRRVITIIAVLLWIFSAIMILAYFKQAGSLGTAFNAKLTHIFGHATVLFPIVTATVGYWIFSFRNEKQVPFRIPAGAIVLFAALLAMLALPPLYHGGTLGVVLSANLLQSVGPLLSWAIFAACVGVGIWLVSPNAAEIIIKVLALCIESIASGSARLWQLLVNRGKEDDIEDELEAEEDEDEEEEVEEVDEPVVAKKSSVDVSGMRTVTGKDHAPASPQEPYTPLPSIYVPPSVKLLSTTSGKRSVGDVKENAIIIKRTLEDFGIDVEMDEVSTGPSVTRYSLRPSQGLKLARISALRNELSLALAAHPIRIEAPIPGQSLVGIEIPNKTISTIGLGTLLSDKQFEMSNKPLTVALGEGVSGKFHYADIAKTPHLLIAGATGSGKSVTMHNMILSLLYRNGPDRLRLIMIDPKRVELTLYNDIPHLLTPVIKDAKKAIMSLRWAAKEMERRYDLLESYKVRDIQSYHEKIVEPAYSAFYKNKKATQEDEDALPEKMPYIVVVIDELADIMQAFPRELESGIVRLAQMSRAIGIHLIISTQRPSVNVITGLIKANVPARLALKVSSQIDSRTILDGTGAESLLGKGDMLYKGGETGKADRIQCAYVSEEELKNVVNSIIKQNRGDFGLGDQIDLGGAMHEDSSVSYGSFEGGSGGNDDEDDLYQEAKELVLSSKTSSTSFLQRKLRIGYSRAARLIDMMQENGIIGPANGSKPREIYGTSESESPTPPTDYDEVSNETEDTTE